MSYIDSVLILFWMFLNEIWYPCTGLIQDLNRNVWRKTCKLLSEKYHCRLVDFYRQESLDFKVTKQLVIIYISACIIYNHQCNEDCYIGYRIPWYYSWFSQGGIYHSGIGFAKLFVILWYSLIPWCIHIPIYFVWNKIFQRNFNGLFFFLWFTMKIILMYNIEHDCIFYI